MKLKTILFISIFLSACGHKTVYVSNVDNDRLITKQLNKLQLIKSDDSFFSSSTTVSVLLAEDEFGKHHIALAPYEGVSNKISNVDFSKIRSLTTKESYNFISALDYAISNYDVKVSDTESLNAYFQSRVESKNPVIIDNVTTLFLGDPLVFSFVNIGNGSKAFIQFFDSNNVSRKDSYINLDKESLLRLKKLIEKATKFSNSKT